MNKIKPQNELPQQEPQEDNTKPWQHWWFWALMIPIGGVLVPLSEALPFGEAWFWITAALSGLAFKAYNDKRKRELHGDMTKINQLKSEIEDLRNQVHKLSMQPLPEKILDNEDIEKIEKTAKGIVVILFTDIESFTQFVEKHGDQLAYERLKYHNQIVRNTLERHNGTEVKQLGDGFMINFASARDALKCASEIQSQMSAINDDDMSMDIRIGIHAGEPIHDEKDFVGRTVILAQRIMNQAKGGQIFVSEVVKNLVGPMKGYQYVDQGMRRLEGISEPQAIHEFHPIEALGVPLDTKVDQHLETLEQRIKENP